MGKSVALLRAINVGGHTVKMDALRARFEGMGFTGVETFIASGNVIFDTPGEAREAVEARIAAGLEAALGYAVPTYVRTDAEIAEIAAFSGFDSDDAAPANLYVGFLAAPLAADAVARFRSEVDDFRVAGREVYWRCLSRQSDSKFSAAVFERALGLQVTFRSIRTAQRLAKKYPPSGLQR